MWVEGNPQVISPQHSGTGSGTFQCGFAVRGHMNLQDCKPSNLHLDLGRDRKEETLINYVCMYIDVHGQIRCVCH